MKKMPMRIWTSMLLWTQQVISWKCRAQPKAKLFHADELDALLNLASRGIEKIINIQREVLACVGIVV